jgi:hypothetical protein
MLRACSAVIDAAMPNEAMCLKFTTQLAQSLFAQGTQLMAEDVEEETCLQAISDLESALEQLSLAKGFAHKGSPQANGIRELEEKVVCCLYPCRRALRHMSLFRIATGLLASACQQVWHHHKRALHCLS